MRKVPVEASVFYDANGNMEPTTIWYKGYEYEVSTKDVRNAASLKAECRGVRYLVHLSCDELELYHKPCHLWYAKIENGENPNPPTVWFLLEEGDSDVRTV